MQAQAQAHIKKQVIELHHYYMCNYTNSIKGIEIYSGDFVTIYGFDFDINLFCVW